MSMHLKITGIRMKINYITLIKNINAGNQKKRKNTVNGK